ncbi:hypothetical protein P4O66_012415, partial [Electrophorus voltai]
LCLFLLKLTFLILNYIFSIVGVVFSSQKRISGADVEMRFRRGDNATLYGDCIWEVGFNPVWFRNCSHENQPPWIITWNDWSEEVTSRYSLVWNPLKQTHDLLIKNITESVLGLYYCAVQKRNITKDQTGVINSKDVYLYGKRTILLSLHDPGDVLLHPTPTPPVSDCGVYRKLLFTVCPVCVLLSSLVSSTCVYCFCRKRNSGTHSKQKLNRGVKTNHRSRNTPTLMSEKSISGAEEIRVRPGDNVTIYCDCVTQTGFYLAWFRNCSHENQPPLIIFTMNLVQGANPHYAPVWDPSSQAHGLLIENVTESDLGLYYCALFERKVTTECGLTTDKDVYHYGNRTTQLILVASLSQNFLPACYSLDCLRNKTLTQTTPPQVGGNLEEVCYALVDIRSRVEKHPKKKTVQNSDFSTYSEVRTCRM